MRASLPAAVLLAVLSLAACDGPVDPGEQDQEYLLFTRDVDMVRMGTLDSLEIYRVNADGTGLRNLTGHPAQYGGLSVSPDGRKVTFWSNRGDGVMHAWGMNTDGTGLKQLTTTYSGSPRWSPDGTRLALTMEGPDGMHVYVMNPDGGNPVKVSGPAMQVGTPCAANAETQTRIGLIDWIGPGRIAFTRHYCGYGYRYFIVNADGSGFTETGIRMHEAFWSPDGSKVVFLAHEGGYWRVMLANADGTGARLLSTQGTHQGLPAWSRYSPWSADGTQILFFAQTTTEQVPSPMSCAESAQAYVVNVDGTGVRPLMDSCTGAFNGWSRSGDKVAFTVRPGTEAADVHVVNADGGGTVNVSNSAFWESDAIWGR